MEIVLEQATLRPWRFGDEDSLTRHANNREIARFLRDAFPHPYQRSDARAWIRSVSSAKPPTIFAIEVEGEAAGGIGLHPGVDVYGHTAELGYWLGEAYWGRGIITAATRAIVRYGFGDLGFTRIHAEVFANNSTSAHVLEKVGFQLEGRTRRAVVKFGETIDELLYGLLPEDFIDG